MRIDVRGPRFAAAVTTLVVITIIVTGSGWLALAQTLVFAVSAVNIRLSPYGAVFRTLIAPRFGPPKEFEPAEPVRFAQAIGFGFAAVAAVGFFSGAAVVGYVAAAGALVAAFLNAAFGLCLGCEVYLLLRRLTSRTTPA